jgi:hypothetical protein
VSEAPDRLFEVPLGEFVAARDELARELREEGKTDQAAEIASLRKPAVPVWVVNQLARRRRRDVDLLLDAGHRLRAAQAEGDPERAREAFGNARDAEREATRRLRAGAEELLAEERGGASDAMVERVLATLRAAAVTEEGRELLARGRLTEELQTTGFEVAASLVPKRKAAPAKRPNLDAARAELERARKRDREASRRLQAARRRAEEAEAELEEARREAEEASTALSAAKEALERARRA